MPVHASPTTYHACVVPDVWRYPRKKERSTEPFGAVLPRLVPSPRYFAKLTVLDRGVGGDRDSSCAEVDHAIGVFAIPVDSRRTRGDRIGLDVPRARQSSRAVYKDVSLLRGHVGSTQRRIDKA